MTSEEIRQKWNEYFQNEANHAYLKPDSLVPDKKDNTVLFTTAGMQQLVPYLVGKPHPLGKKLYNTQKCVRTGDIDEVGDERHLTFFEMLGNWSLGDYFKEQSLKQSIQFLNEYLEIPIERIGASIFEGSEELGIPEDNESRKILNDLGIPDERIKALDMEENFWGPAGEIGPCGPCCEIHIDRGEKFGPNDWDMGENDRFLEVWNNVFMEYYKNEDGTFTKLKQQNVDTGMGLERLCMIMQGTETVFEADLFKGMKKELEKYGPLKYFTGGYREEVKRKKRIMMDHIRTSVFLLADGVIPSNEGRGYILRKLIRRFYYTLELSAVDGYNKVFEIVNSLINEIFNKYCYIYDENGNSIGYKELDYNKEFIYSTIEAEINLVRNILTNLLDKIDEIEVSDDNIISGKDIFKLYDTYGYPFDIIKEVLEENAGYELDEKGFYEELEKARERSRAGANETFKRGIDWSKYLENIPETEFIGYDYLESKDLQIIKDFEVEGNRVIILDKTPFYPEGGGQTADKGIIFDDNGNELKVYDVQNYAGVYLHFVE